MKEARSIKNLRTIRRGRVEKIKISPQKRWNWENWKSNNQATAKDKFNETGHENEQHQY